MLSLLAVDAGRSAAMMPASPPSRMMTTAWPTGTLNSRLLSRPSPWMIAHPNAMPNTETDRVRRLLHHAAHHQHQTKSRDNKADDRSPTRLVRRVDSCFTKCFHGRDAGGPKGREQGGQHGDRHAYQHADDDGVRLHHQSARRELDAAGGQQAAQHRPQKQPSANTERGRNHAHNRSLDQDRSEYLFARRAQCPKERHFTRALGYHDGERQK